MKKFLLLLIVIGFIFTTLAANSVNLNLKLNDESSPYYSSPDSHSAKMKSYIHFFVASEAGDDIVINQLATDDITWDFDAGSEVPNGLPWIGLFKGKKQISQVAQKIKAVNIQVLSREYYLVQENESQLIVVARDNVRLMNKVEVTNVNFVNIITFRDNKIAYIKTVEDNSKMLRAYQRLNCKN